MWKKSCLACVFLGSALMLLVGCGAPGVGERSDSLKLRADSPELLRVPQGGALKPGLLQPSRGLAVLDPKIFAQATVPEVEVQLWNAKVANFKVNALSVRLPVNYPNLHACGLKFALDSENPGSANQWGALLKEFSVGAVSPSNFGTKAWELKQPVFRLATGSRGHKHIEMGIAGSQLYLFYFRVFTASKRSWRQVIEQHIPQAKTHAFQVSVIPCKP